MIQAMTNPVAEISAAAPSAVDVLLEAAKLLSPQQRRDFFDRFTEEAWNDEDESMEAEDGDPPLSQEWMEEIQRRVAEDEAGLTTWTDAGEMIRKARESLNDLA